MEARSHQMYLAGYYLSRLAQKSENQRARPPKALNVDTWNAAYDKFYESCSGERDLQSFRNSMEPVVSTFDYYFPENNSKPWSHPDGEPGALKNKKAQRVLVAWENESDLELERYCIETLVNITNSGAVEGEVRSEGGERWYVSKRLERRAKNREAAINIHGCICKACGFDFNKVYGDWAERYIEVHHIVPLSKSGETVVDPRHDLTVLCANCHRMVHKKRGMVLTVEELKSKIAQCV